jgi:hypothetical protein
VEQAYQIELHVAIHILTPPCCRRRATVRPRHPGLADALVSLRWSITTKGNVQFEDKQEWKSRLADDISRRGGRVRDGVRRVDAAGPGSGSTAAGLVLASLAVCPH